MNVRVAPPWLRAVLRPPLRAWLRLDVEGADRMPRTGPVIVASTHRSYADIPALATALPRPLAFLGSAHLRAIPLTGGVLRSLGLIPVERGAGDREALERCLEVLGAGGALVVFPEGGRSRDGAVHPPRSGVARLAATAGCPIVPVGLTGTEHVWPPDGRPRLRGAPVVVRVGEPLEPPSDDIGSRRQFVIDLHAHLVALTGSPIAHDLLPLSA